MLYYKIENYIQLVVHNNSENLRTTPFDNFLWKSEKMSNTFL